ncbi:MAG: hypothetical protein KIT36_02440 [Alphaproteobacteria bacterium]|nr:hypothetical protein [Alphaproteobacteria bacterium]
MTTLDPVTLAVIQNGLTRPANDGLMLALGLSPILEGMDRLDGIFATRSTSSLIA